MALQKLLLTTTALLLAFPAVAAELSSQVDRTRISANETLNLTLEYSEQVDTRQLDFSGLRQDFEIMGNSTQTSVNIVNGLQTVSTRWNLVLLPRRSGALLIPSFQIEGNFSQAIEIEVSEASAAGDRSRPLNVEMSLDRESIYAQEQLLLTVKLTAASSVSNLTGDSLDVPGAEVYLLSQERYAEMVDGANWQVIEWRYALFFDQAGSYEIPAQVFSGLVGSSRSVFDPFGSNGERVIARAPAQGLQIQPPPRETNWLPAQDLKISSTWPGGAGSVQVGEPVTRQILIEARGQRPEVIPPVAALQQQQVRSYADQPQLGSDNSNGQLISQRIESAALVATEAGEITLPEIRIPWWDQSEQVWKEALLPAETLLVQPAAAVQALAPPPELEQVPSEAVPIDTGAGYWPWVASALGLLSLLLLMDRMRLRRRLQGAPAALQEKSVAPAEQAAFRRLQQALAGTDAAAIEAALQQWLGSDNGIAAHLAALQDRLDSAGREDLERIMRSRYARNAQPMQAPPEALTQQLQQLRSAGHSSSSAKAGLPPLYPA